MSDPADSFDSLVAALRTAREDGSGVVLCNVDPRECGRLIGWISKGTVPLAVRDYERPLRTPSAGEPKERSSLGHFRTPSEADVRRTLRETNRPPVGAPPRSDRREISVQILG